MVKKQSKTKNNSLSKKQKTTFFIVFWSIVLIGFLFISGIFISINNGWIGYVPPIEELQNPKNKYASEIISSDGQTLGTFYTARDNRINTSYYSISEDLVHALIATEDERYYTHSGIDIKALFRVFFKRMILMQKGAGGGSTISQQLAKQLYSPQADNFFERALQKPIEWVIAVKLEKLYTKEEIITMYLNQFDFLNNAVGIQTASKVYFNTTPSNLKIEEAATLIGMLQNPALYNPASNKRKEQCRQRRNVVINRMEKVGYISEEQRDSLKELPITLDFKRVDHKLGIAPYFREYLRLTLTAKEPKKKNYNEWQLKPYGQYYLDSIEWENNPLYGFIEKNPKPDGTKYDIYKDGLKIYTTIDSRMQQYAEEAVEEHFKELQSKFFKSIKGKKTAPFASNTSEEAIQTSLKRAMKQTDRYRKAKKNGLTNEEIDKEFNTPIDMMVFSYDGMIDTTMSPMDSIRYYKAFARCGVMSINPANGHVKAYVGGPNFSHFQYDMVNAGRRQVGSTVKPYLYSLAMSEGYWPCNTTINQPITIYNRDDINHERPFTPRNSSKNRIGETVTLKWGLQNSNNWISAYVMSLVTPESLVRLMRSFGIKGFLDPVVAICLGSSEVTVAEMVDAYTVFPNKGIRTEPIYVTHIEDNYGNIIAEFTPITNEVLNEESTNKMLYMLQSVINEGTGVRVRYKYKFTAPAGGKTGTTNDNSDGWFIGFTPELVTGVWVGWEDRTIHFSNMADGQGASMALPIWGLYMNKVYNDTNIGYSNTKQFDIDENFDPNAGCK
ncbi:MAG: transglycosylase domain-containing protein [Paludibacteraceae bacterium]|nr:transglycosylase domain-containing protein [Paludibacteraceae bacterium]